MIVYDIGENLRSILNSMLKEIGMYSTASSSLEGLKVITATIKELLKLPTKEKTSLETEVGYYNK